MKEISDTNKFLKSSLCIIAWKIHEIKPSMINVARK